MKRILPLSLAALSLLSAAFVAPALAGDKAAGDARGEAELAKIIEGRVAGEPVNCLRSDRHQNLQIIDRTAIIFRDGKTVYVNRPDNVAFLDDSDLPVIETFAGNLCRLDRVELRDRISLIPGPVVILGEFVPYTKPDPHS